MTEFTSGTQARDGRKVNHDPEPIIVWEPDGYWGRVSKRYPMGRAMWVDGVDLAFTQPRPEFDVLDNPILAAFRSRLAVVEQYEGIVQDRASLILDTGVSAVFDHATSVECEHARRVLSKLAALA